MIPKSAGSSRRCGPPNRRSGKRVAYIGGIDLCHVGPEFGDPNPVDPGLQEQVRSFDDRMLDRAAACDPGGWFRTAAQRRQPLSRLRYCRDLYNAACDRARARPLAQVQAGPRRSPDLLRELRQHGIPCRRAFFDHDRDPCRNSCLTECPARRLPMSLPRASRARPRPIFARR